MPAPKGPTPYNKKGKGGRPIYWTDKRLDKVADQFEEWLENKMNIFYYDFVYGLKMCKETWFKYTKTHGRLGDLLKRAKLKQEISLMIGGLTKKFDANFCKYILERHHKEDYVAQGEQPGTVINVYSKKFSRSFEQDVKENKKEGE